MTPTVLVIDHSPSLGQPVSSAFRAAGWSVVPAGRGGWREAAASQPPSLVLHGWPENRDATPDILRASAIGEAPIVAWGASTVPPGFDDRLARPCPDDAVIALAARWWPQEPSDVLDRLVRSLGAAEIDPLLMRLRHHLVAATAMPGTDPAGDAHRIAGIAGMLGFDGLGAAWLAVSHREPGAQADARIATRRALLVLSRR